MFVQPQLDKLAVPKEELFDQPWCYQHSFSVRVGLLVQFLKRGGAQGISSVSVGGPLLISTEVLAAKTSRRASSKLGWIVLNAYGSKDPQQSQCANLSLSLAERSNSTSLALSLL